MNCKELLWLFSVHHIEDVLWTDEENFMIEVTHNAQNSRQLPRPDQRYTRKRKIVAKSLFAKGPMVWVGITANQKTPLALMERNVKIMAETYREEVLQKVVLPFYKKKNSDVIFQRDWAPAIGAGRRLRDFATNSIKPGKKSMPTTCGAPWNQ